MAWFMIQKGSADRFRRKSPRKLQWRRFFGLMVGQVFTSEIVRVLECLVTSLLSKASDRITLQLLNIHIFATILQHRILVSSMSDLLEMSPFFRGNVGHLWGFHGSCLFVQRPPCDLNCAWMHLLNASWSTAKIDIGTLVKCIIQNGCHHMKDMSPAFRVCWSIRDTTTFVRPEKRVALLYRTVAWETMATRRLWPIPSKDYVKETPKALFLRGILCLGINAADLENVWTCSA